MKRIISLLLVSMFAVGTLLTGLFADTEVVADTDREKVEIVLLLDVSGSMNTADPEITVKGLKSRISTEVAMLFTQRYPSDTDLFIKLIPYSSKVYNGFESVNISTELGRAEFEEIVQKTLEDDRGTDTIPGFNSWKYQTNIGLAMKRAAEHLELSDASKKSVILFTDGRIELPAGEIDESYRQAEEAKNTLESIGAPVHCVGLNYQGNNVDKDYLEYLSGSDSVPGITVLASDRSGLLGVFNQVYEAVFPNSQTSDPDDDIEVEIKPDVPSEESIRIYGDAVREANISLISTAPLRTVRVTAPNGSEIAFVDYVNNKSEIANPDNCLVTSTPTNLTANIKLLRPMDGDWLVEVTGEEGTAIISQLYLFDLELRDSVKDTPYYVGENVKFDVTIQNSENKDHIKSESIYTGADAATAKATVLRSSTGDVYGTYQGMLNSSSDGFDFSVQITETGRYEIELAVQHKQFTVKSVKTIELVGPKLSAEVTDGADGKVISLNLIHPVTGKKVTSVPEYLKSMGGTVYIKSGAKTTEHKFNVSDMTDAAYQHKIGSLLPGDYTAWADIKGYGVSIESAQVSYSIAAPELVVSLSKDQGGEGKYKIEVTLTDPATGEALGYVPGYLSEAAGKIIVSSAASAEEYSFSVSDMTNGSYTHKISSPLPGVYTVRAEIRTDDISLVSDDESYSVLTPGLGVAFTKDPDGKGNHTIDVRLTDPATGGIWGFVPDYFSESSAKIVISSGSNTVFEHTFKLSEMKDCKYQYAFVSTDPGDYTVRVTLTDAPIKLDSGEVSFTLSASSVSVSGDTVKDEISYSGLSADYSETLSVKGLFADSDGDKLKYKVSSDNETVATAELDGTDLIIKIRDFGEAVIKITATDGKGASASYEISVKSESTLGTLILIVSVILALIIIVIIIVIIINKKKIINLPFRVKIAKNTETSACEAVFDVGRLSANKYAKPKMSMSDILSETKNFSTVYSSNFDAGELSAIISAASHVRVTGQPFKRAFDIIVNGKKKSTFTKTQVVVSLHEQNATMTFGSASDFEDSNSSGGYGSQSYGSSDFGSSDFGGFGGSNYGF